MKLLVAALLLLGGAARMWSQGDGAGLPETRSDLKEGILQWVGNATVHASGHDLVLERIRDGEPMTLRFTGCQGVGVARDADQWWILPTDLADAPVRANSHFWILPLDALSKDDAWQLDLKGADAMATKSKDALMVSVAGQAVTLSRFETRPHSDPFGHRFSLRIEGGADLEGALAAFYWGTMLPSVVERTLAAHFPYSSGYVLSTLNVQSYAGSYPAVDHEFQIKGRLAMGTEADLDVVRRMIELQFQLMKDDPERLHRSPTSVQPNGTREYHIRRDSKDGHQNAAMFPLTGNIEVVEESWRYYEARKDRAWLRRNIGNLEDAAGWTIASIDGYGRVWSDVYYEDQVIKDGRETEAQAFAAQSFGLLAKMERLLGQQARAAAYAGTSKKLAKALIAPLPMGYWDDQHHRFVDWVDRTGTVHDHVPLLANTLPVTFGYATPVQVAAVEKLVEANAEEFERFSSFVAADLRAYDGSEMGVAGPYDLSAAGRYWYWDAAFRASRDQNAVLSQQLEAVAAEGRKSGYLMGERYDMDHVYYVDGKDAHGAERYYEYPNVYAAVLISEVLGLSIPADADLSVAPHLSRPGEVEFDTPMYAVRYVLTDKGFSLTNLSDRARRFKVDLSAIGAGRAHFQDGRCVGARCTVTLAAQREANWSIAP